MSEIKRKTKKKAIKKIYDYIQQATDKEFADLLLYIAVKKREKEKEINYELTKNRER